MYTIVTGAAGFIGSNLVRALNERGAAGVIAVDDLSRAEKFVNLVDCEIADFVDKRDFIEGVRTGRFDGSVEAVLHQGACSDTMASDGRYVMENNYRYSATLLEWSQEQGVPFLYASSAAVYGASATFREEPEFEAPLNVYGYSKLLFDQLVRRRLAAGPSSQIVGLRYFNVYGPRERHKGRMASVALHCFDQLRAEGRVRLFEGSHGCENGGQKRDFVFVDDIARVNLHFLDHPEQSGIFNLGSGRAREFNAVAVAAINGWRRANGNPPRTLEELQAEGAIEYVPFPDDLRGRYQAYTEADLTRLRAAGYDAPMTTVEEGVSRYVEWLACAPGRPRPVEREAGGARREEALIEAGRES